MALNEVQALMDFKSRNLGYAVKTDSNLRLMVRNLRSRTEECQEVKDDLVSKEDEIKNSFANLNADDFTFENGVIIEQEDSSYNGKTLSELEEMLKDEQYNGQLDGLDREITKITENLEVLLGEMELRLEDVVERIIQGG